MRRHNCHNIIFSSSATVYGDPASVPIREDFPVGGTTNPFGTIHFLPTVTRFESTGSYRCFLLQIGRAHV